MADNILYKLRSGKPIKFLDFVKNFSGLLIPDVWYRSRRERMLAEARRRPDYAQGSWYFTFKYNFDKEMAKRGYFTVDKGSVTVNGVSLTVCNPTSDTFQVAIIPYTYEHTNFHTIKVGSVVNIEFDIIGKYLSRMMQLTE